ncbi:hypothetical protein AAFC00_002168 [Neodothiora populina]
MACPDPRMVYWGFEQAILYNEAAATIIGHRHPGIIGKRFVDVWGPDIFQRHMDLLKNAIFKGRSDQAYDFKAILERDGRIEETYWNIHLLPVPGHDGHTIAAVNEYTESTSDVYNDQRRKVLAKVSEHTSLAQTLPGLWSTLLADLEGHLNDTMYVAIYTAESDSQDLFNLEGFIGAPTHAFTSSVDMTNISLEPDLAEGFRRARASQQVEMLSKNDMPPNLAIDYKERGTVSTACICPISSMSGHQLAFIVVGLNPQRPYTEELGLFINHVRDLILRFAAVISLPEEQRKDQLRFEELNLALTQQLRITALKAEKNEETFMRMARNAPFGMYMYDPNGDPKFVNDSYLELLHMTRSELAEKAATGLAWRDTVYEEDAEFIAKTWQGLRDAKTPTKVEYRIKTPDGNHKWVENLSFPELDEEGRVVTVMGWLYDISHRKLTEALMAEKLEDALENKRASERFIDMTSHEMRNPLSAILQLADEISSSMTLPTPPISTVTISTETADTILDAAQTIVLCAQHQKNIVDDVLTISKLDSNLLVITPDKVNPLELIRKALKMYDAELRRAEITCTLEVRNNYTVLDIDLVMLDPSRLLQVVINLLTNAIKFTKDLPDRKITLILSASKTPPTGEEYDLAFAPRHQKSAAVAKTTAADWGTGQEVYIQIAVKDTGKGLTQEEMKVLFHRFSQGNPRTYKQYGGSGLGLFISQQLTHLQGGQIGVHSEAGVGSIFAFFVKARRVVEEHDVGQSKSTKRRRHSGGNEALDRTVGHMRGVGLQAPQHRPGVLHVLVVEDNAINQRVMAQQLRRLGCIVSTADHGLDALSFLTKTTFYRSSAGVPLSVVLMDLEMPVMDGLTCISRIRELERTGEIIRHVPVIAITANARSEQIQNALAAGMNEVVTKPFTIRELMPRMEKLVAELSPPD